MQSMPNMVSDTLEALSQQSKEVAEKPAGMQARVAAGQDLIAPYRFRLRRLKCCQLRPVLCQHLLSIRRPA